MKLLTLVMFYMVISGCAASEEEARRLTANQTPCPPEQIQVTDRAREPSCIRCALSVCDRQLVLQYGI
jgi:hypothetical protein